MKSRLYIPVALISGLFSAEIVASIHVYMSNLTLWQFTDILLGAGYLAVPNTHVAADLRSLLTAIAGGVFFTLSLGAGLSMLVISIAWVWDRILLRNPKAFRYFIGIWVICIVLINISGFNIAASAYLVTIPVVTWVVAVRLMPPRLSTGSFRLSFLPIAIFIILTLLWSNILKRDMFINIRDYLLLSNPVGQLVNDFYYRYTLFPAETFKSLSQQQIRTCNLDGVLERSIATKLEKSLRYYDFLSIKESERADLNIETSENGDILLMKTRGKIILEISSGDFFKNPMNALNSFSEECDSNRIFRSLVFYALLIGFPLVLYTFIYSLIYLILGFFLPQGLSIAMTAFVSLVIGVSMLIPVYQGSTGISSEKEFIQYFSTGSLSERISILRRIWDDKGEIADIKGFEGLVKSPHLVERYWVTRCLAYSKHQAAQDMLYSLLREANPIVVCQAFWALGYRREGSAIEIMINRIKTSTHWYEQHYGYRAIRSLGWIQARSKQYSY